DIDQAVSAIAVSGSNIYVGGQFDTVGTQERKFLTKLSTMGAGDADETWNPSPNGAVTALAANGTNVYVGGTFDLIEGIVRSNLAKLNADNGSLDESWNPNPTGNLNYSNNEGIKALCLQGANLFVAGDFSAIGGQSRLAIAKLSTDGV